MILKKLQEEYKRLTDDEYNLLIADKEVSVTEHKEYEEEFEDDNGKVIDKVKFHDVVIQKLECMVK